MTDNSFSLIDLYPKYVINSKGEKMSFDENSIAKILNKETGLDMSIAKEVAEDVIRRIIGIGIKEITTNYIRELVCVELTQRGMNKYRNLFARAINLENISFKLDEEFIENYKGKQPDWGPIGYVTYKRTYARIIEDENRKEEFFETIRRVVEGCYSVQKEHCMKLSLPWSDEKAQKSAQKMFKKIWEFKMSPPGRGLWMMGTEFIARHGSMALNNCFSYETEIITRDGIKKIGDLAGTTQSLLSRNGKWIEATIRNFGKQKLMKLTLRRQGIIKEIYATPEHRWFVNSRKKEYRNKGNFECKTAELEEYYNLAYMFSRNIGSPDLRPSPIGIARGITFGDGTKNYLYLCGEKDKELLKYFPLNTKTIDPNKCEAGAIRISNLPKYWKLTPPLDEDTSFLYGWLAGYFAADGSCDVNGNIRIASSNLDNILFVRDVCSILGIGYYCIRKETRHKEFDDGKYSYEHTMYSLRLMPSTLKENFFIISKHKKNYIKAKEKRFWQVISVEENGRYEDVYCATVPETHSFVLEGNILTGNCGFASTEDINLKYSKAFEFVMDALMLGVGVGFDTKGAGKLTIKQPKAGFFDFQISDSREGWVEALKVMLEAYFLGKQVPKYDFSLVRPAGQPIRGFGGVASGPDPLKEMLDDIQHILKARVGQKITSVDILDIMNHIGKCVVSGNVRRSAEIALGDPTDLDFVTSKQDEQALYSHRWASNNSIFAVKGLNYSFIANQIAVNGEPGIFWLENAKAYSRMGDKPDDKDKKAAGVNPCIIGDTLIAVADGRNAVPIKQLAMEDADVPVYCKDNNGTTQIRMMRNPRITGYDENIYEVKLDDESVIKCTRNHKFFLSDMSKKAAIDLKAGDSLMLAYRYQTPESLDTIPYKQQMAAILKTSGSTHNHKVVSVRKIGSDIVYNGTVDEVHNYGIVLTEKKAHSENSKCEMIFTANCGEQTLESFELCCLVETFPSRHETYEEFQKTLKFAYLYSKSVTLVNTHWKETNAVMLKNRRMGISQTGIIEAFVKHGRRTVLEWCNKGYDYLRELDEQYSGWLCIPRSIKITTVKPSGTVSLLPGVPPGIHYPHSEYYIRRIRISKNSDLIEIIRNAGYKIEEDLYSPNTVVAEFPIHEKYFDRSKNDVSIWEQIANAIDYQRLWSDNQVSITVTFKPEEGKEISRILEFCEDKLKSVSFLPIKEHGYKQAPYEEITKEQYDDMVGRINQFNLDETRDRAIGEKFCDSDRCEVRF